MTEGKIKKGSRVQINQEGFNSHFGKWSDDTFSERFFSITRDIVADDGPTDKTEKRFDVTAGELLVVLQARCATYRNGKKWGKLSMVTYESNIQPGTSSVVLNPAEWFYVERRHIEPLGLGPDEDVEVEEKKPIEKQTTASIRAKYLKTVTVTVQDLQPAPAFTAEKVVQSVASDIVSARAETEKADALVASARALLVAFVSGTKEEIEGGFFGLKDAVEAMTGEDPLA